MLSCRVSVLPIFFYIVLGWFYNSVTEEPELHAALRMWTHSIAVAMPISFLYPFKLFLVFVFLL